MKSHLPPTRVQLHSTQANTVATLQALCAETGWGLTVVGMPYVGPTGDAQTVCVVDGVALLRARVGAPGQGCVLICEPADLRPWVGVPGPVTEYQFAPIRRSSLKEQVTRLRVGASHTLQQCKLNGDLFLDPVDRRVLRGDQALDLTWREYEVLRLLMDAVDQVVPRQRIEEALYRWGQDFGSNTVDVLIHHLRRKLDPIPIDTVRGLGHRMPRVPS